MSLDQFLELHKLEAKSGESVELWMALWTMGYNHSLQPDESFNFKVNNKYISNGLSIYKSVDFHKNDRFYEIALSCTI